MKTLLILTALLLQACAPSNTPDTKGDTTQTVNVPGTNNVALDISTLGVQITPPDVPSDAQLVVPCGLGGLAPVMVQNHVVTMLVETYTLDGGTPTYYVGNPQSPDYKVIQLVVGTTYVEKSPREYCEFQVDASGNINVIYSNWTL